MKELKKEATDLGITFPPNIKEETLKAKIEAYYEAEEAKATPIVVKEEVETTKPDNKKTMRQRANEAEIAAKKTQIVTIVDNDQRENNLTTTVSVNCSNDYFDLGTKRIPLNIPVELEQGFINVLKEIKIPMHTVNQITGLGQTTLRNRYSLSTENELKKD